MRNAANLFTDPVQVRGALYASADRIASVLEPCAWPACAGSEECHPFAWMPRA